jgi:hypothetical protein
MGTVIGAKRSLIRGQFAVQDSFFSAENFDIDSSTTKSRLVSYCPEIVAWAAPSLQLIEPWSDSPEPLCHQNLPKSSRLAFYSLCRIAINSEDFKP